MHFEGLFCIRRVAQLQASQESQAMPPRCPPLPPALQPPAINEPASRRWAGHRVPPLPATSSCRPCGSHSASHRPIFPLISLAQLALTETGRRLDVTLPPPATQHPSVETGLSPSQSSLALARSFPKRPGQARLLQSLHLPPPRRLRLHCPAAGQWLGNVLTEGDFSSGTSVRLRGPLRGAGGHGGRLPGTPSCPHCHLASHSGMCSSPPSPLPTEQGSLWTKVRPLTASPTGSAGVSAVSPSSQPPKSLAASPSSVVHPPCWRRATRQGRLSPSLGLQADGRHQLPAASLHDNLSRPLPFGDTPSHGQLIPSACLSLSRPQPSPDSPVTHFLGKHLPKGHLSLPMDAHLGQMP